MARISCQEITYGTLVVDIRHLRHGLAIHSAGNEAESTRNNHFDGWRTLLERQKEVTRKRRDFPRTTKTQLAKLIASM